MFTFVWAEKLPVDNWPLRLQTSRHHLPSLTPSSTKHKLYPPAGLAHEVTTVLNPDVLRRNTATDNTLTSFPIHCQLWAKYTWFAVHGTWEETSVFSKTYLFPISKNRPFTYENLGPSPLAAAHAERACPREGTESSLAVHSNAKKEMHRYFSLCWWGLFIP